jgi:hypothetical protein
MYMFLFGYLTRLEAELHACYDMKQRLQPFIVSVW